MKNLIGKTAIVTGASRGIGVHIVDFLTKNRVNVIGVARSIEGLKTTAKIVENNQGEFSFLEFDLSETSKISITSFLSTVSTQ